MDMPRNDAELVQLEALMRQAFLGTAGTDQPRIGQQATSSVSYKRPARPAKPAKPIRSPSHTQKLSSSSTSTKKAHPESTTPKSGQAINPPRLCSECGRTPVLNKKTSSSVFRRCTGCRRVWYCSIQCQTKNRIIHQLDCLTPASQKSTANHFKYSALSNNASSIRLLRLLPGLAGATLRCQLFNSNIKSALNSYEALSYTWGDPTDLVPIVLNGKLVMITRNLHEALQDLRSESDQRIMWIDAICINQNDVSEKNEQLRQMRQVYSSAQNVIMWVGRATDDSDLAFDRIEKMSDSKYSTMANDAELSTEFCKLCIDDVASNMALSRFGVTRPYWQRAWIVQEVIVAQKAVITCSRRTLPWDSLCRATVNLRIIDQGLFRNTSSLRIAWSSISSLVHASETVECKASILHLLWHFRTRECLDPRDKIYAFLGLPCREDTSSFTIDYSLSVEQVYASFATWHMKHTRTLNILNYAFPSDSPRSLSSWIPDWRMITISPTIGLWDSMLGLTFYTAGTKFPLWPEYFDEFTDPSPNVSMTLLGVPIDRIKELSPIFTPTDDLGPDSAVMRKCLSMMRSISHDRNPYISKPIDTSDFTYIPQEGYQDAVGDKSNHSQTKTFRFPTGHTAAELTIIEAFWRTLVCDLLRFKYQLPDPDMLKPEERNMENFPRLWRPGRDFWPVWQYWYDQRENTGTGQPATISIFADMVRTTMLCKCFMITENGYMGVVSPQAAVGDLVVACAGANVPHILRKMNTTVILEGDEQDSQALEAYQHQGDCFVHGVMYGEAMKDLSSNIDKDHVFVVV